MRKLCSAALVFIVLLSMGCTGGGHAAAPARQRQTCSTAWSSIDVPPGAGDLRAVAQVNPAAAWAVGTTADGSQGRPLIFQWNGTSWRDVPTGALPPSGNLEGVAAFAVNDVWAVGHEVQGTAVRPLVMHWDGSAWFRVAVPSNISGNVYLQAVGGGAPDDLWIVGEHSAKAQFRALTMHWNGKSLVVVPVPTPGIESFLYGVAAGGQGSVWVAGYYDYDPEAGFYKSMLLHWQGKQWSVSDARDSAVPGLFSGVAMAADGGWAVGQSRVSGAGPNGSLLTGWLHRSWHRAGVSGLPKGNNWFRSVAIVSDQQAWAVGSTSTDTIGLRYSALIATWDGTKWSVNSAPPGGGSDTILYAVAAGDYGEWAVGSHGPAEGPTTPVILRRCAVA